tara:strand:+ start:739 stop:1806 length:1068 start_codon:yes stop_codon:yes gene_type:complete
MAAFTSIQPTDHFNTVLYTGNGSTNAITGVGFQPDLTWVCTRSNTGNKSLVQSPISITRVAYSNIPNTPGTDADAITSFDADGFTLGSSSGTNANTYTFLAFNWKGGTTSGITTDGSTTITPSAYSFNQAAGFSVFTYTGNGSAAKLAHGLGKTPEYIWIKNLGTANDWSNYHQKIDATTPEDWFICINNDFARIDDATKWNDIQPDSVNISLGTAANVNTNTNLYIGYAFAPITGYSQFGSFDGNGNADGPFIYTGFRPAKVNVKNVAGSYAWDQWNNKSSTSGKNPVNLYTQANDQSQEYSGADGTKAVDLLSNGFKMRATNAEVNNSGSRIIYSAWAEFPFVSSNSIPGTAR